MSDQGRKELFDNSPFMTAWEKVIDGHRFTYVRAGNSVGVIPIRRNTSINAIEIMLIQEPRLETSTPMLKAVGGYLHGRPQEEMAHHLLLEEAGIACEKLHLLVPRMEGFTVIELPIATYLALDWHRVTTDITACIQFMTLAEGVELVLAQRIPDQCTADAIMRLALLEARNRLPI